MALDDLTRARTREQVVARMLDTLSTDPTGSDPNKFLPTSYLRGGSLRTLLEIQGEVQADAERTVAALAKGGYLQTASGLWLDAFVSSHYGLSRQPSSYATGLIQISCTAGSGPYDLEAGTVIVSTLSGLRYFSIQGGTVPAGGTLSLEVQAESAGSAFNVTGAAITVLNTPQPGLTVTNAANWLTAAGVDAESDDALRLRAALRWTERGGGATRGAYQFWALTASPAIDQVRVLDEHPRGQGTVDVVVWGSGGIGAGPVALADAYIQARRPVTADVHVYRATENTAIVPLSLYAPGADRTRIEGQILTNLAAVQKAIPIGGVLYTSALIEAAMEPAGMIDAKLPDTYHDIELGPTEALTLYPTLTWRDTP